MRKVKLRARIGRYLLKVLVGVDQLCNATLGGNEDETISSSLGRARIDRKWFGFMANVVDWLFYAITLGREVDHCNASIEWEEVKEKTMKCRRIR